MDIKVFRLNDYEWWAGETLEEVKKNYTEITGVDGEEAFDESIEAMSEEALKSTKYHTDTKDKDGKAIVITFAEELENRIKSEQKFPCFFATTDF